MHLTSLSKKKGRSYPFLLSEGSQHLSRSDQQEAHSDTSLMVQKRGHEGLFIEMF